MSEMAETIREILTDVKTCLQAQRHVAGFYTDGTSPLDSPTQRLNGSKPPIIPISSL